MKIEPTIPMQIELATDLSAIINDPGSDLSPLGLLDALAIAGHALVPDFDGISSPSYFAALTKAAS